MIQWIKSYFHKKREKRLDSLKESLDRQLVLRQDRYEQGYVDGYNEAIRQLIVIVSQSKDDEEIMK